MCVCPVPVLVVCWSLGAGVSSDTLSTANLVFSTCTLAVAVLAMHATTLLVLHLAAAAQFCRRSYNTGLVMHTSEQIVWRLLQGSEVHLLGPLPLAFWLRFCDRVSHNDELVVCVVRCSVHFGCSELQRG